MLTIAIFFQLFLLPYHQATTLFDFYPFNNVRYYTIKERLTECGVSGAMMVITVMGFVFYLG